MWEAQYESTSFFEESLSINKFSNYTRYSELRELPLIFTRFKLPRKIL